MSVTLTAASALLATMVATSTSAPTPDYDIQTIRMGLVIGEPVGFTLNVPVLDQLSIQGEMGRSSRSDASFVATTDAVWLMPDVFGRLGDGVLVTYAGFGLRAQASFDAGEDARFGFRAPFGVAFVFAEGRREVYAAVAPALSVVPEFNAALAFAVGVRLSVEER